MNMTKKIPPKTLRPLMHSHPVSYMQGQGWLTLDRALHAEDGSLPKGLTVQNAYMELCDGSKNVAMVVRNSRAYSQALRKKTPVARAVVVTWVLEPPIQTNVMETVEEAQGLLMQN